MSTVACQGIWPALARGRRDFATTKRATGSEAMRDDDLVTWLSFPLSRTGRTADGAGVAPTIWEDGEYGGEADALALTLRGLARLEDEVLSV